MKSLRLLSLLSAGLLSVALIVVAQQGPKTNNGDTVARPKKGGSRGSSTDTPAPNKSGKEDELPPLPSAFKRIPASDPEAPPFHVDATAATRWTRWRV